VLAVTFYRDSRNRLSSFFASGHAGFDDYGSDIVCAAVSGILQAARLGLEAHLGLELETTEMEPGNMRIRWAAAVRDDPRVVAIVTTAELAVEQIARQYPDHVEFLRVADEEA
jgi:hypothetical protein